MATGLPVIPIPYMHSSVKRRKNTWYSIADGNWTDRNIWMSNSVRRYNYPQTGDDVYINHNVVFNMPPNTTITLNNLRISGAFSTDNNSGRSLIILGDLQATSVNLTSTGLLSLYLYGVNNYINNFTCGTSSIVHYMREGDQPIMPVTYRGMYLYNNGVKQCSADLAILGNMLVNQNGLAGVSVLNLGGYNISVSGSLSVGRGEIRNVGSTALIVGNLSSSGGGNPNVIDFTTNNTNVELRGGITFNTITLLSGTGTWKFTTNSQTVSFQNEQYNCNFVVSGAITVTNTTQAGALTQLNGTLNGDNVASKWDNRGSIYFNNTTTPMATGSFIATNAASIIGYVMNGNYTLPYSSYVNLRIRGTGTKTPPANLIVSGELMIGTNDATVSLFDMAGFDLTCGSLFFNYGTFKKTGSGAISVGTITINGSLTGRNVLDLSTGNPSVNITAAGVIQSNPLDFNSGTGTWTYDYAGNQNILPGTYQNLTIGGSGVKKLTGNIVVLGTYTVTGTATLDLNGYTKT